MAGEDVLAAMRRRVNGNCEAIVPVYGAWKREMKLSALELVMRDVSAECDRLLGLVSPDW